GALRLLRPVLVRFAQTGEVAPDLARQRLAFLPVLLYAHEGDSYQAKRAVFFLEFKWHQLKDQYQNMLPEEGETFNRIDGWLGDAYYAIDANNPGLAANQLEHVKYEMMEIRHRYGVAYYLDGLYAFQSDIGLLHEAANDEMLCLMEWGEFEHLLRQTQAKWEALCEQAFDAELYEFDAKKQQQLKEEQRVMREALSQFAEAASYANRLDLAQASSSLQPAFFGVLKLFGSFETSQTYFALQ
ncbi:MAG TPA: hypothetical protein PLU64_08665, partial [Saprospiraceae bacterium]|nr:hypothetical protein [Saprospiraceae bacterium]